jgi:penicillin-binding protein 2
MNDLKERRKILLAAIALLFIIFALRLFYLQVLSADFAATANKNVVKRQVLEPSRGIVYDRNGKIYVTNSPIFDLSIVPNDLQIPDTSLIENYLHLDRETIRKRIHAAIDYNKHKASIFEKQISPEVYTTLQEHLWQTKGISTVVRTTRNYLYPVGANFLGYISEVNKKDIGKSEGYYEQGDLKGTSGLESKYETYLRGRKGVRMTLVVWMPICNSLAKRLWQTK